MGGSTSMKEMSETWPFHERDVGVCLRPGTEVESRAGHGGRSGPFVFDLAYFE